MKKTYRVLLFILASVMVFSIVLTGCSPKEPTTVIDEEIEETVDEPTREKVIVVSRSWEATDMDPVSWTSSAHMLFGPSVFENLMAYGKDLNFIGRLAENWENDEDFKTFRFFLHKGVQFHHGYGELKASDVVFSFKRAEDPDLNAAYVYDMLGIENIESIEAEDDYTVKISLKSKDHNFYHKLATWYGYIVSEKAVEDMGKEGFALKPVGTGPFAFDKGTPNERTEVVRFDDYWGEKAKLDRVVFQILAEHATIINAFESGEVDFLCEFSDTDKLLQYKEDTGKYYVDSVPSRNHLYVGMNFKDKHFKNKKVREALTYAIDRDEMIKNHFMSLEKPAPGIIPAATKYSVTDKWNPVYDPDKTKSLLAEAGYANGFDTEFYCPNDLLSMGPATLVQSYLVQAGINANLKTVDFGVFLDTVRAGKAPIWLLYDSTGVLPDEIVRRYMSEYAPGRNWCMFTDPEYDKLAKVALEADNEEMEEEYFIKAQVRLTEQTILYSLCTYTEHSVMHSRVKNFALQPNFMLRFDKVDVED